MSSVSDMPTPIMLEETFGKGEIGENNSCIDPPRRMRVCLMRANVALLLAGILARSAMILEETYGTAPDAGRAQSRYYRGTHDREIGHHQGGALAGRRMALRCRRGQRSRQQIGWRYSRLSQRRRIGRRIH